MTRMLSSIMLVLGLATACVTDEEASPPRPSSDAGVPGDDDERRPLDDDLPSDPGTDLPEDRPCLELIDDGTACPD